VPNARAIALKYMSPRYLRLERLEKYQDGDQYDGRPAFFSQDEDAPPLLERAPCIVDGVAKNATRDLVDFMMGEGRYPVVSASTSEDDADLDDEGTLTEDEAGLLERWINGPLTDCANLRHHFPEALRMAMKSGSVALVACMRNGRPEIEAFPAKWCTPAFNPLTREVIGLEIKYPYIVEEQDPISREWEEVCYVYRRLINANWDVVYLPGKGREDGLDPVWSTDWTQTVQHNLGFCPVRWYAFECSTPTPANYDGRAHHKTLLDELDALNFSRSQRHRAAVYSGDPQIWETGVEANTNPAPMTRAANVQIEAQASGIGPDGRPNIIGVFTSNPRSGRGGPLRRKGPGIVWRYPEATSKVGMLSLPEGSLGAISENSEDIRQKIAEDLSVVLIQPSEVKSFGALSGKALAFVFARQIARADSIRNDSQTSLLFPTIDLLLRLCLTVGQHANQQVRILGFTKILPILQKFVENKQTYDLDVNNAVVARTVSEWFGPRLRLQWGDYFESSAEEENFVVQLCATAYTTGLMPLETVLEKLRGVFPFASIEEILGKLEEEQAKKDERDLEMTDQKGAIAAKHDVKTGSASGAKGDKKA